MQVAQGQNWQGGIQQLPEQPTGLNRHGSKITPGGVCHPHSSPEGLHSLDSRACAALLKELSKNGLSHHALTIFDWLQSLPSEHELSSQCDVFTYTTGMAQADGTAAAFQAPQSVHHLLVTPRVLSHQQTFDHQLQSRS